MVSQGQTKAQILPLMMVHQIYSCFSTNQHEARKEGELERGHSFVLALMTPTGCLWYLHGYGWNVKSWLLKSFKLPCFSFCPFLVDAKKWLVTKRLGHTQRADLKSLKTFLFVFQCCQEIFSLQKVTT